MRSIRVNDENEIQVSHHIFKGRAVLDIRKFYRADPGSPWKATSKGITFDASRGAALLDLVRVELSNEPTPEAVNA